MRRYANAFLTIRGSSWTLLCVCAAAASTVLVSVGCQNAALTSRREFVAPLEPEDRRLADDAWDDLLAEHPPSQNQEAVAVVNRVGRRIAAACGREDCEWEFQVLASSEPDVLALPDGKVAVHEGILGVCQNEAGLAAVLSHEIAHVVADHGAERISNGALAGIREALSRGSVTEDRRQWRDAYGIAVPSGELHPFHHEHETEADSIGLTLMARAGYDPAEAPRFWERLAAMGSAGEIGYLARHPCDLHRSESLAELVPQAAALYESAAEKFGLGAAIAPAGGVQHAHFEGDSGSGVQTLAFTQEHLPPVSHDREDQFETAEPTSATSPDSWTATSH
jgi:predicted Zn-dependent protease